MTDKQCLGEWFAEWMASRCPEKLTQREFQMVAKRFLKGSLIVVFEQEDGDVEIWVK